MKNYHHPVKKNDWFPYQTVKIQNQWQSWQVTLPWWWLESYSPKNTNGRCLSLNKSKLLVLGWKGLGRRNWGRHRCDVSVKGRALEKETALETSYIIRIPMIWLMKWSIRYGWGSGLSRILENYENGEFYRRILWVKEVGNVYKNKYTCRGGAWGELNEQ